ncbi:uncharacterized protein LOC126485023 [Schistocerca serialis cubense]|uniref:uncharacterized protein LOC126485023 n=1 Tax=Schistocerca serialis cubense TaxID=2023355 RepID=UPI00214E8DEB|nr:uncharacterized protein LOC126485023 [Schistocerca serialis cubense]
MVTIFVVSAGHSRCKHLATPDLTRFHKVIVLPVVVSLLYSAGAGWHSHYHSNHLHHPDHQHHHRHKQHEHHYGHFQPPVPDGISHRLHTGDSDGGGDGGGGGGGELVKSKQWWPPDNAIVLPAPRTAVESPTDDKDGGSGGGASGGGGAVFLSENCTVVLAQTGTTPRLHCEVADVGESVVSWIRRKDYRLLTVGLATYSSDDRFFTAHVRSQQDWALHVRFSEPSDAGLYECQVSTHPPSSLFVELQLVEAHAELLGGPDKLVKRGSALRLVCALRGATEPPVYVFWYHGGRMVNYDAARGLHVRHAAFSSELLVQDAQRHHSGNYSCVPSNARPASISVHVINGAL